MKNAIAVTNQPNPLLSARAEIRPARKPPAMLPSTAAPLMISESLKSSGTAPATPKKPASVFMAITSSEVPTAGLIGSLVRSSSAGTITKPPPAPSSPVSAPTAAPW
jgi:hypothetical protein